jgi:hypothetical protein
VGIAAQIFELTTPQATAPRIFTSRERNIARDFGPDPRCRWIVTNNYLPADRLFFSAIFAIAAAADDTLFVAASSIVSAAEAHRRPRASNGDWYADNGAGVWRVAPDGRVTAFAVSRNFDRPSQGANALECDTSAAASLISPSQWGGMALAPNGEVYVSDQGDSLILRLTGAGRVERVAGGGDQGCVRDPWKKKESGWRDGPARQALFSRPRGLVFDRQGNLLVADYGNCAIRMIDTRGEVSTLHRGCYADPAGPQDLTKRLFAIHVAIDPQGRPVVGGSFFAHQTYTNIHRLNSDGRLEQILTALKGYSNTGQLRFEFLNGLGYLPDATFLLSDGQNLLRTLKDGRLSNWLGHTSDDFDNDVNDSAAQARIVRPGALAVSPAGTVFIAPDLRGRPLRKVEPKTRLVRSWLY